MITGSHLLIYSNDAEADRTFFRDVLQFPHIDAGDGWLIFKLPPAEMGVHPSTNGQKHELSFTVKDIHAFVAEMKNQNVPCSDIQDAPWGLLVAVTLPGGSELGVYEPRHTMP